VPTVSSAVNGASFQSPIVTNSWAAISGTNISPITDTWANAIVNGGVPTTLDGVSVTIGGQPAYVYFINGTQINCIVPNIGSGPQQVVVKNAAAFTSNVSQFGPAFFPWPGKPARRDPPGFLTRREGRDISGNHHRCGETRRSHHPIGNRLWTHHASCAGRSPVALRPDLLHHFSADRHRE